MTRSTWIALVAVGMAVCMLARPGLAQQKVAPRPVADHDIDRVIDEITRYLYARQDRDGTWDDRQWSHRERHSYGGTTALALFALLEAQEHPEQDNMKKGIEALVKLKPRGPKDTYFTAFRVMVLSQVLQKIKNEQYRKVLRDDVEWLVKGINRTGAWGYTGPERDGDNSCSQIALLSLWEADRADVKLSASMIRRIESVWAKRQQDDGGWKYDGFSNVVAPSTLSMTSAALASLYICLDIATIASGDWRYEEVAQKGWKFLAEGLKPNYIDNGYLAFCVQRVGLSTGRKFIDDMDWFQVGAKDLCKPRPYGREYKGNYGSTVRACFELIFLARGRTPLTFNKLQHNQTDWNYHSRDVPRFTEFMRRNFEQRMRWQVVDVTDEVERMLDAPILLISGIDPIDIPEEHWAKLREYTLGGGTMLFIANRNSEAFIGSVRDKLAKLYQPQREKVVGQPDDYQLVKIDADHPVYHSQYERGLTPDTVPLWGVSDGTRMLAILCGRDIARGWQRFDRGRSGRIDHQMGANFFFYATGGNLISSRMRPVFAGEGREKRHTIRLAWLKHPGNWCTQPMALGYVDKKLTAENLVGLEIDQGVPIERKRLIGRGYDVLWMTGSDAFKLNEEQINVLRDYISDGGTLFVNAVGGSKEFAAAAEAMLQQVFAGEPVFRGTANPSSGLQTGKLGDFRGPKIGEEVKIRRSKLWRDRAGADSEPRLELEIFQVRDRPAVVYSNRGLHDTLDGHAAYGSVSYLPDTARAIAANVMLYLYVNSKALPAAPDTGSGSTEKPAAIEPSRPDPSPEPAETEADPGETAGGDEPKDPNAGKQEDDDKPMTLEDFLK